MAFVKYHQPCPLCGSSDAASLNEDGSAYCFSCDKRVNDYENLLKCKPELIPIDDNIEEFKVHQTNSVNEIEGSFAALTDRGISLATAKKYNVKALKNNKGEIALHLARQLTGYWPLWAIYI